MDSGEAIAETIRVLNGRILSAIKGGDLKYLKELFAVSTDEERTDILKSRAADGVVVVRPSSGNEVVVKAPSPLVISIAEWHPEVVEFLASYKVSLKFCAQMLMLTLRYE